METVTDEFQRLLLSENDVLFEAGCDLLDGTDRFVEDITVGLVENGSDIHHNNYRTIHGTCTLLLARELDWAADRVRPWMRLSGFVGDGVTTVDDGYVDSYEANYTAEVSFTPVETTLRVNLGVFLLVTPERQAGETPRLWRVQGYDKLLLLNTPHGESYRAEQGDAPLTLVAQLLASVGQFKVRIDQTKADVVLPAPKVWPVDPQTTTLHIINALLAEVGYRGLWVDGDGFFRSEPSVSPAERAAEWVYDADDPRTIVAEGRVASADFFSVPNRWVFIRDDPAAGAVSDGDGRYEVNNLTDGPTSQNARAGRIVTRVERLQAADQESLEAQGDRLVENDLRVIHRLTMDTAPNPLHGHFDVVHITDSDLGIDGLYLSQEWTLPLNGDDMRHELRAV